MIKWGSNEDQEVLGYPWVPASESEVPDMERGRLQKYPWLTDRTAPVGRSDAWADCCMKKHIGKYPCAQRQITRQASELIT